MNRTTRRDISTTGGVPVGLTDSGAVFQAALSHVLIVAASGGGKGSLLWAYLMGAEHYLRQRGTGLDLYGWDPKRAEFAGIGGGRFTQVAFDPDTGLDLLKQLVEVMRERQSHGLRSYDPTALGPVVVVAVDEFNTLTTVADSKWRAQVRESLLALTSQGRSAGIYIVACAQQPQKESVGDYRPYFMSRFCGRVETPAEVDMVLGPGSSEQVRAWEMEPATESNGYKTAGIFWGRSDSEPNPVRFRAPRITDEDIAIWCRGGEVL